MMRDATDLYAHCRAAWPKVVISREAFAQYLAARQGDERRGAALDQERARELYLCCACVQNDPQALLVFDRLFVRTLPGLLVRLRQTQDFHEEVQQLTRHRLFLSGRGQAPRIAAYTGRGPLVGWVRKIALRTAFNLLRSRRGRRLRPWEPDLIGISDGEAVEASTLRRHHRNIAGALEDALGGLSTEQWMLLRQRYLLGVGEGQLALRENVNRCTINRRIKRACKILRGEIRLSAHRRLGIGIDEFAPMLRQLLDAAPHSIW